VLAWPREIRPEDEERWVELPAVGEAAVVGAGSVVRTAVPALQIWAGNPARFLAHLPASGASPLSVVSSREGRR
jgi:carbonic anhydrase/acetyltransferase-like protein (isoleucine patch superfamily)